MRPKPAGTPSFWERSRSCSSPSAAGADSLALAAATAFEAPRAGARAGAVIVDHGLQRGSADIAAAVAAQAAALGLDPVLVRRVAVGLDGGPEAAARARAVRGARRGGGPHRTRSACCSGTPSTTRPRRCCSVWPGAAGRPASTAWPEVSPIADEAGGATPPEYRRPLLGIRRATTAQFCVDSGLEPWDDPQNEEATFARVRVRRQLLPTLERDIGPGIAEALARTADQLREDASALCPLHAHR